MSCVKQTKMENKKSIVEIYTDWANHYLEKTKGKPKIKSLQTELRDGLLLTEVIEAVTHQKVPDIVRKPKTADVMVTNIQACLNFLLAKGVAVEEIRPQEVHEGNMKAILGLFFQLSRYKQQQKQQLGGPVPGSPAKLSSIPVPGSTTSLTSPAKKGGSGLRSPRPATGQENGVRSPPSRKAVPVPTSVPSAAPGKQSMLSKLRLGKSTSGPGTRTPGLGKRTSSSSGFSSARSEASSTVSLSSDTNFPSPNALRRIQEQKEQTSVATTGRASAGGGLRSRLTRPGLPVTREKSASPRRSPKLGRAGKDTELKDYGLIDSGGTGRAAATPQHYPPHAYSRSNSGLSLKHTNISRTASSSTGGSSIPSPRGRPPAPPSRRTSDPAPPETDKPRLGCGGEGEVGCNTPAATVTPLTLTGETVPVVAQDPATSSLTASYLGRTCSLPRQPRTADPANPSPAVAVVSPMPHMTKSASLSGPGGAAHCKPGEEGGEAEDALRGIAPMAPLARRASGTRQDQQLGEHQQ